MRCMEAEMSSALTAGREGSGEELFCISGRTSSSFSSSSDKNNDNYYYYSTQT